MQQLSHLKKNETSLRVDAKPWDIFQYEEYAVQKVHDGQVRCAIYFRGNLNLERLKRAAAMSIHAIPQLDGRFIPNEKQPYWQLEKTDIGKLFTTVTTNCTDDEVTAFLPGKTDCFRGPQIRFKLVRGQARDTLCIIVSRLICDEAGLKEYIYLLGRIYSDLQASHFQPPKPESLYMQRVLHALPPFSRLKVLFCQQAVMDIPRPVQTFPLSGREEVPFIVTHTLPVSRYQAIARYALYHHVRIDEVLLTAYIRAVYAMLRERPDTPFPIACQTDLRRFLSWGNDHALCGLSLPILFVTPPRLPADFHQTMLLIHSRFAKLQSLAAVIENAKVQGLFPFSVKHTLEHRAAVALPSYRFSHIGKIEPARLQFGDVDVNDAYVTGPIYTQPHIGLCSTVYEDSLTFSCNLTGTRDDWATCKYFLALLVRELPADRS